MRADGKDHSLTGTSHHDGVLEKNVVGVQCDVLFYVLVRALLRDIFGAIIVREEESLVNLHVHLIDEHAVGGHSVTLIEDDDVTDNEVFDVDGL